MPEGVTTRPFSNPGVFAVFHNQLSDATLRNGLSLVIQKEDVGEVLWSNGKIIFQCLYPSLLKRDFPFCVAFAAYCER